MKIYTVDAFTSKPFQGNPAGVMILDNYPDDSILQSIAMEMNLSETAFIKPIKDNYFHIRWFTPKVEVKLCGHATLASSCILFSKNYVKNNKIEFESLSGVLSVTKNQLGYTLDFPLQQTGPVYSLPNNIFNFNIINSVQAYDDIIIELESEIDLKNYNPDIEKLSQIDCRGIILTAKSNSQYDFVSRFFAPRVGVNEDPVTGSAHCKLAHYWSTKLNKNKLFAYQASHRGGELNLEVSNDRVLITGEAVIMLEGELTNYN